MASRPVKAARSLDLFGPATREWFSAAFEAPTRVQEEGWRHLAAGRHALLLAPTGSGKTLAAFLACLDRLTRLDLAAPGGVRVLYVSPLKALAYDVERNLRVPLAGIERAAERLGERLRPVRVSVRTGDTPERERRQLLRDPGDVLITTPESLYLLLGSAARETLRSVETVIVDEIHALAPTKRGAHLALSLERLVELCGRDPQRVGLSATQRPLDEVARFLAGERTVSIVDAAEKPRLDLVIEVPVDDMERVPDPPPPAAESARPGGVGEERGIWTAIYPRLLELVQSHHSTIVFVNSRRLCERLAQRLNELSGLPDERPLVRAHHGSIARAQREEIEQLLKGGALRGIVATSSLELGIDMGAVDLVVQIESPGAVSRGLQRIGRAGHSVGERSSGRIFPKYRGDLLEAAVVGRRMLDGDVEPIRVPKSPLDVLAQQLVAVCATPTGLSAAAAPREWRPDELLAIARRAYPFRELSRELLDAVLDMLSGRYPPGDGAAFADLRPRLVWDRARDLLTARRDARMLALVNGGTIPDRGLYGVYLGEEGPRVGELDEEMVHESRPGQTFLLGASTWRIVQITRDRVIVQPAPGEPGKMPFWRGEGPGRPVELGRALGAFVRALGELDERRGVAWLEREYHLDPRAAANLWRYVAEQREATGTLPTDRSLTVERFRDELGDWRVCILSPFGARVHAPWALALEARLGKAAGFEVQTLWSDDGIVLRFADADETPPLDVLLPAPDEVEELVLGELGRSAMFATHFRENAARALLLPRRRPGARTPLWSQRLRAQGLLAVASRYPSFPIVLETYRECMSDVFDVPALVELLSAVRRRELRVVEVESAGASPFARSLAFAWVAAFLYEGDAPLAERRAQALTLDRTLLRELLGQEELRDLLEPAVLDEVEAELQALAPERHVRHADALHDLLRRIGDLDDAEIAARSDADPAPWLVELERTGRVVRMRIAGHARHVAVEDVARYRDALGAQPPPRVPPAFLDPAVAPLESLLARYARTHAPFTSRQAAARFGLLPAQVEPSLRALVGEGRLAQGEFRPGGAGDREWCDTEVLRQLRRRTLARLRNAVAPVEASVLARFLPRWHGVAPLPPAAPPRGVLPSMVARPVVQTHQGAMLRLRTAVEQLEGLALPLSELERSVLPARVPGFAPRMLDELGALGELVWVGRGALGQADGRVALYRRERVALLLDPPAPPENLTQVHQALLDQLAARGASFYAQLQVAGAAAGARDDEVLAALWDLVWAGLVTNDTFQPLRAVGTSRGRKRRAGTGGRPAAPRSSLRALGWGGAAATLGRPEAAGRWSAVSELVGSAPSSTEVLHARALVLLERYGIVSREAAAAESVPGGFAAIAPVLRALEEAGRVRRGFFVEGLGGSQYAHAGAVDRLRAERGDRPDGEPDEVVLLAAVDPANPYGALLPWPTSGDDAPGAARNETSGGAPLPPDAHQDDDEDDDVAPAPAGEPEAGFRPRRVAGAQVILVGGVPVLYLEAGGRRLRCFFAGVEERAVDAAVAALSAVAAARRHRELSLVEIDGVPALRSPHARLLQRAGFRPAPGRLVLESPPPAADPAPARRSR